MKLLFDFLPLAAFFAAFKLADIYWATGVAIAASVAVMAWVRLRGEPVSKMMLVSLVIIVVFGGATLLLQDERFIKIKPTALYWILGGILLGGRLFARRNLLKSLLGDQLEMPARGWDVMSAMWIVFFAGMGVLNLYVAWNYPTDTWVNFKVFWSMGLLVAFSVVQGLVLSRYIEDKPAGDGAGGSPGSGQG
jgi:intracellular septation protein